MSKFREKIVGRITNNLSLKIISFLFAIVVWLVVVNVGDPVTSKVYKNVPVLVLHEEFLTDEGQVYQVRENTDTVDITVRARRSVLKEIKEEDFSVTADMREMVYMESVRISVTCENEKYEDKIEAIYQSHDTLLVSVEEMETKEFILELASVGKPREGYTVGKTSFQPDRITISGPKSIVSKIDKVVTEIDVDGAASRIEEKQAFPVLYDADGGIISNANLTLSNLSFWVTVPIWQTKSVAVEVTPVGEVAKGYSYDKANCYPTAVTITGEDEILRNVSSIEIPEGVVDISGASEDLELSLNIEQYLPEGIYLVDKDTSKIRVTVGVSRQVTKNYQIAVNQIGLLNAPEDYRVSFGEVKEVTVALRGTSSELGKISEADIKATINLNGLGVGMHQMPLEVVVSGNVEIVEPVQMNVYIAEKNSQNMTGNTQNQSE